MDQSNLNAALVKELLTPPPRPLLQLNAELFFLEGQYLLHWQEKGEHFKFLSPETLRLAFRQMPVDSDWLLPGICRWGSGVKGQWLVKFVPPGKHHLTFAGAAEPLVLDVPLPPLVFAGVGETYYLWAVKKASFDPEARLFHAPLPNVHRNGTICFGSNRPPQASSNTIEEAWQLFISSPFNADLADGKSRRCPGDIREQLHALGREQRKKYPLRDLVPLNEQGISLNEMIERTFINGKEYGL